MLEDGELCDGPAIDHQKSLAAAGLAASLKVNPDLLNEVTADARQLGVSRGMALAGALGILSSRHMLLVTSSSDELSLLKLLCCSYISLYRGHCTASARQFRQCLDTTMEEGQSSSVEEPVSAATVLQRYCQSHLASSYFLKTNRLLAAADDADEGVEDGSEMDANLKLFLKYCVSLSRKQVSRLDAVESDRLKVMIAAVGPYIQEGSLEW